MRFELEVLVRRGSTVESRHRLQCAVVDAQGTLLEGTPNAGLVTMFRSSAKPFQLLSLVERGHADRMGFTDEQLAEFAFFAQLKAKQPAPVAQASSGWEIPA